MAGVLLGARDRTASFGTALANTNTTTCYTNNNQQAAKGVVVHIGNENGGTIIALVYWYDLTATTEFCLGGVSIGDDLGAIFDLGGIRLDVGDEIRVKAANLVDVVVTVTEFQGPG